MDLGRNKWLSYRIEDFGEHSLFCVDWNYFELFMNTHGTATTDGGEGEIGCQILDQRLSKR